MRVLRDTLLLPHCHSARCQNFARESTWVRSTMRMVVWTPNDVRVTTLQTKLMVEESQFFNECIFFKPTTLQKGIYPIIYSKPSEEF